MCHSGRNLENSPLDNAVGILLNFLYLCLSDTVRVNVKNRTAEKYRGRCYVEPCPNVRQIISFTRRNYLFVERL